MLLGTEEPVHQRSVLVYQCVAAQHARSERSDGYAARQMCRSARTLGPLGAEPRVSAVVDVSVTAQRACCYLSGLLLGEDACEPCDTVTSFAGCWKSRVLHVSEAVAIRLQREGGWGDCAASVYEHNVIAEQRPIEARSSCSSSGINGLLTLPGRCRRGGSGIVACCYWGKLSSCTNACV